MASRPALFGPMRATELNASLPPTAVRLRLADLRVDTLYRHNDYLPCTLSRIYAPYHLKRSGRPPLEVLSMLVTEQSDDESDDDDDAPKANGGAATAKVPSTPGSRGKAAASVSSAPANGRPTAAAAGTTAATTGMTAVTPGMTTASAGTAATTPPDHHNGISMGLMVWGDAASRCVNLKPRDHLVIRGFRVEKILPQHSFDGRLTATINIHPDDETYSQTSLRSIIPQKKQNYVYTRLSQRAEYMGGRINVFGVVKFFKEARRTAGTDMLSVLSLVDDSLQDGDEERLSCNLFFKPDQVLPVTCVGQIVRFHRLKIQQFAGKLQGTTSPGFAWLLWEGEPGASLAPRSVSGDYTLRRRDTRRVQALRRWAAAEGRHVVYEEGSADILLQQLQPTLYTNFFALVVSRHVTVADQTVVLRVTDGSPPGAEVTPQMVRAPETLEMVVELCTAYRGLLVDVSVHDNHFEGASALRPGDFAYFRNVHATREQGAYTPAEGAVRLDVHQGTQCGRGVHRVPPDRPQLTPLKLRLKEVRKRAESAHTQAQNGPKCDAQNPSNSNAQNQPTSNCEAQNEPVSQNISNCEAPNQSISQNISNSEAQNPSDREDRSVSAETHNVSDSGSQNVSNTGAQNLASSVSRDPRKRPVSDPGADTEPSAKRPAMQLVAGIPQACSDISATTTNPPPDTPPTPSQPPSASNSPESLPSLINELDPIGARATTSLPLKKRHSYFVDPNNVLITVPRSPAKHCLPQTITLPQAGDDHNMQTAAGQGAARGSQCVAPTAPLQGPQIESHGPKNDQNIQTAAATISATERGGCRHAIIDLADIARWSVAIPSDTGLERDSPESDCESQTAEGSTVSSMPSHCVISTPTTLAVPASPFLSQSLALSAEASTSPISSHAVASTLPRSASLPIPLPPLGPPVTRVTMAHPPTPTPLLALLKRRPPTLGRVLGRVYDYQPKVAGPDMLRLHCAECQHVIRLPADALRGRDVMGQPPRYPCPACIQASGHPHPEQKMAYRLAIALFIEDGKAMCGASLYGLQAEQFLGGVRAEDVLTSAACREAVTRDLWGLCPRPGVTGVNPPMECCVRTFLGPRVRNKPRTTLTQIVHTQLNLTVDVDSHLMQTVPNVI